MGLIWLILAAVGVWMLTRLARQIEGPRRRQWRVAATIMAAVLIAAGGVALAKGAWIGGAIGIIVGLQLAYASRMRTPLQSDTITLHEARSILGVQVNATAGEINAAWRRLMGRAHPDQGGTEGLASRLNAARDRLLRK